MHATKPENAVLAGVVVFFLVLTCGATEQPDKSNATPENPYADARLLVEAFLVDVNLDSLHDAGLDALAQKTDSAVAQKVLTIVKDTNKGQIKAGAKLALGNGGRASVSSSSNVPVPVTHKDAEGQAAKTWSTYALGTTFKGQATVDPNGQINLYFDIKLNTIDDCQLMEGEPLGTSSFDWETALCLESGRPVIAGAVQNIRKMTLLILRADIEDTKLKEKAPAKTGAQKK